MTRAVCAEFDGRRWSRCGTIVPCPGALELATHFPVACAAKPDLTHRALEGIVTARARSSPASE